MNKVFDEIIITKNFSPAKNPARHGQPNILSANIHAFTATNGRQHAQR
jgi:hypothetical protein